jgi:hypothetical protein
MFGARLDIARRGDPTPPDGARRHRRGRLVRDRVGGGLWGGIVIIIARQLVLMTRSRRGRAADERPPGRCRCAAALRRRAPVAAAPGRSGWRRRRPSPWRSLPLVTSAERALGRPSATDPPTRRSTHCSPRPTSPRARPPSTMKPSSRQRRQLTLAELLEFHRRGARLDRVDGDAAQVDVGGGARATSPATVSTWLGPARTEKIGWMSSTRRVSGPQTRSALSSPLGSGQKPVLGTMRPVGLWPMQPQKAAGMRIEPPPSACALAGSRPPAEHWQASLARRWHRALLLDGSQGILGGQQPP